MPQRLSILEEQLAKAEEAQKEILTARIRSAERALELAVRIGQKNYDDAARSELQLIFSQDQALSSDRAFTPALDELVGMLKDAEAPGDLRKPGPSLRFSKEKLDSAFVYDWTENPKRFRPTTRMPQFFGLWDHLQEDKGALHTAQKLEPVELHAS